MHEVKGSPHQSLILSSVKPDFAERTQNQLFKMVSVKFTTFDVINESACYKYLKISVVFLMDKIGKQRTFTHPDVSVAFTCRTPDSLVTWSAASFERIQRYWV